ncbi:MAG TPA: hypothetical protein VGK05_00150 [Acidimicrobiia bacterium]
MDFWQPARGEPELMEWWRPLVAASHRARVERVFWPIYIEEFALGGRVDRGSRPSVWVYVHLRTKGEVLADGEGRTYEFVPYRAGPALGRFKEIEVRHAVWRARLPDFVEPIWYEEPSPRPVEDAHLPSADDVRERRHLRLVSPPA